MRATTRALLRLTLCLLGAGIVGVGTWLAILRSMDDTSPWPGSLDPATGVFVAAGVLGVAAWLGSELALRAHPAANPPDRRRLLVWLGGIIAISLLYGALLGVLDATRFLNRYGTTDARIWMMLLVWIAAVAFALSWLGRRYGRGISWLAGLIAAETVLIAAAGLGMTMSMAFYAAYHSTCDGHRACRILSIFTIGTWWGFSIGTVLGGACLALALGVALTASGLVRRQALREAL